MNKKLQTVISVFALAFILLIPGISAKAGTISTVNATGGDSVINVSGSAGSGVVSVVILVYDETGTDLVMMQSTEVKDDHSFADVISASVGNYVVKVADYDGGAFAETTVTVSESSVPEPQPEPEPTPTPEPQPTPTPEPQPTPTPAPSDNSGTSNNATTAPADNRAEAVKAAEKATAAINLAALEKNADAALKVLVDNATTEELATAVQNDPKLLEKLDKLEDKFVEQNNITVKQSVSTQAAKVVDEKKISVVGAGFNTKPGDTVRLNIAIPVKQEKVNTSIYPNAVQLDIKLVSDSGEIKNLKVPVTITMPVPQGVKKDNLVILHYKTDGSYDVLIPKQNADGTITFTVSHFSTFVFAQSASVTAPKTGEQIAWTIYGLAILGMIGAMVYVFTRKKE